MVKTTPFDAGKYLNFTYEEFKDWVHIRDPAEEYDYMNNDDCAVARFLKDTGRADSPSVGGSDWHDDAGFWRPFPPELRHHMLFSSQKTMGELQKVL